MLDEFLSNSFVQGGLTLAIVGGLLAYLRNIPPRAFGFAKRRFVYAVDIQHIDIAFKWVLEWLNEHPSTHRSKYVSLSTRYTDGGESIHIYSPLGSHFLFYKGRFLWINRNREKQKTDNLISLYETMTISTFSRKRGLIEDLIKEAERVYEDGKRDKVVIHTLATWGEWSEITRKAPRAISSVILPDGVVDRSLADIRRFLDSPQWYKDVGVPYRRGYLLHGPPGNGKTSLIFAIASELKYNLAIMNLSSVEMTDSKILQAFGSLPKESLVVMEDIDAIFEGRESKKDGGKLTFSGLLNALDGVATSDGRMLFMTTNHPEKLDPALIRPGRVDVDLHINHPAHEQVVQLYLKFFPDKVKEAAAFADSVPEATSAATLQEYFLTYRDTEVPLWSQV